MASPTTTLQTRTLSDSVNAAVVAIVLAAVSGFLVTAGYRVALRGSARFAQDSE